MLACNHELLFERETDDIAGVRNRSEHLVQAVCHDLTLVAKECTQSEI